MAQPSAPQRPPHALAVNCAVTHHSGAIDRAPQDFGRVQNLVWQGGRSAIWRFF